MDKETVDALEVKPMHEGWYRVVLFQFKKEKPEHPDYIEDWVYSDGVKWVYNGYEDFCYVCFVTKKEEPNPN